MLQEHIGISLLEKAGIKVPQNGVAKNAEEAYKQAQKIGSS